MRVINKPWRIYIAVAVALSAGIFHSTVANSENFPIDALEITSTEGKSNIGCESLRGSEYDKELQDYICALYSYNIGESTLFKEKIESLAKRQNRYAEFVLFLIGKIESDVPVVDYEVEAFSVQKDLPISLFVKGLIKFLRGWHKSNQELQEIGIHQLAQAVQGEDALAVLFISKYVLSSYDKSESGVYFGSSKNKKYLLNSLMKSASMGWPSAAYALSRIYSRDAKSTTELALAVHWLEIAAALQDPKAIEQYEYVTRSLSSSSNLLNAAKRLAENWLERQKRFVGGNFYNADTWCKFRRIESDRCAIDNALKSYFCSALIPNVGVPLLGVSYYRFCMESGVVEGNLAVRMLANWYAMVHEAFE